MPKVYVIVDVPDEAPVTEPETEPMDASALLMLHRPPVYVSLSKVVEPTQTFNDPEITTGRGSMVTTTVV